MAKTVIGLFDDHREAQHIVQALVDDGFRREDIRTLTSQEEASVGTLSADGVPEAEAQAYADAVRRGGALVLVDAADDRADRAVAIMERSPAVDRETRTGAERGPGRAGRAGTREVETGDVKVPVVEEELQVGTRQVQRGGVRLYTRVTERPVEETVRLRDETVHVERRPVDRPATEADFAAATERTVEVTETDEEAVVRKQARVVEEVVVGKARAGADRDGAGHGAPHGGGGRTGGRGARPGGSRLRRLRRGLPQSLHHQPRQPGSSL